MISKRLSELLAKQKCLRGTPKVPVLMLYEDARCGKRAVEVYDALVRRFGREYDFQSEFCTFDALTRETARSKVMENSRDARLIILSAEKEDAVPPHTRRWIELWLDKHGQDTRGLMTLLHRDEKTDTPGISRGACVRKLAAKPGVALFRDSAGLLPERQLTKPISEPRTGKSLSFMDWILTAAVPARLQAA